MKQKLLFFLIALLGLLGNSVRLTAQDIPEPTAQWNFENADDLMAPDKGSLTLTPALLGARSITLSTLGETEIVQAEGPTDTDKSICVPKKAALKLSRAEGAETSTAYTILMDIMVPNANPFNGLLQMDEANSNDGDLFTNAYKIGIGSMGYAGSIQDEKWYRVVFTYDESNAAGSQARLYVNGKKIVQGGANQRHVMAPFGLYLLCDEDGEKIDFTYLSEVAFWETPLTDEQVGELGGAVPPIVKEIASAADLLDFADLVNEGNTDARGILTADITLSEPWDTPIGIDGTPYAGIFDGQGHKISGFNGTSIAGKFGLFGFTSSAVIKDFSVDGTLTVEGGTGSGVVGWTTGSTILGVHSTLKIAVTEGGTHHVGGVVGSAQGGNTISGCTFAGSMTVVTGNNDNFAGVVSYLGGDRVEYCANYGTITYADLNCSAGGIAGYLNNTSSYVKNCLNVGKVSCMDEEGAVLYGSAIVGRLRTHDAAKLTDNCWIEGSAYGAGRTDGGAEVLTAACLAEDKLASGAVCYVLNGDQTEIGWYQTLGTDETPVLDSTHGQVYMVGRLHCNGDVYTDATYTNTYTEVTQDDHDPVDGFCSYCGLWYEDFFTPNADGFYEIANARQLAWFEQKVNTGNLDANAILTADIDFAQLMPEGADPEETEITWVPIGDWGNVRGVANAGYKGHFDGQGHTIKNLNATARYNFFGLFGVISSGAVLENFTIYGTYKTAYQYLGGVAAYARDEALGIRNVHSYVNIFNTYAGGRQGGIMGGAHGTYTFLENCTYSGTMSASDSGGSGNYGGILGYANNSTSVYIDITNCLFDGQLVNTASTPGNCTFGGIVGYANSPFLTIKNCLSIGSVESARYAQFIGALNGSNTKIINSYYQGDYVNGSGSGKTANPQEATEVTDDQLASGEICWKLNEASFIDPLWRQIISEQTYPVPYGENGLVYQTKDGDYETVDPDDPSSVATFISNVVAIETIFIEETVAYQELLDDYAEEVESWENIDNLETFLETYKAAMELKESINTSAANYAAYEQACADAVNYLAENELEGEWKDLLLAYLDSENEVEPNTDYPNGSYAYIMENLQLDNEALLAEIAFVNQMLENAIAGGITAGTEITRLLANPTFADGYEGWTVEYEGGTATVGGKTEIMPIPEAFNNISFNASQTLIEQPNGIYMMALNGLFRSGADVSCQFYAGQLYLNNTFNYFMSPGEDIVYEEDAEPGVNCLGENTSDVWYVGDEEGWVPNTRDGCSVAFNAGRYVNYVATEVTDGTLTVGTRNLGTGLASDWMPFGNLHVYYLGTVEEANDKLADVLNGYAARAQVILDFPWSDNEDYVKYPNFYEGLKEQLQDMADAVEQAANGESKMNLINRFSDLFNQIHACRRAYIVMYKAVNNLTDIMNNLGDAELISDDVYNEWDAKVLNAQMGYLEGTVTAEQALAIAEELNNANLISLDMVDGAYQLTSADDLLFFARLVNFGMNTSNAVLVNDIDMADLMEEGDTEVAWPSIGDWNTGSTKSAFAGHFDGQGHTIKNFNVTAPKNFYGLFGVITTGCLIENFSIYGTLNTAYQYAGPVAAYARDEELAIRNVHSYVDMNNTCAGGRQGGILGGAHGTLTIIEGCTYSGTLGASDGGGSGNYGGILGYANNSTSCTMNINNCLFDGVVVNTAASPGNCTFGGIVGYANSPFVTISNCLSIGKVQSARYAQFFGALNGANSKILNSYYQGDNLYGSGSGGTASPLEATKVTDTQLASGEVCYKLNETQPGAVWWYQTIFEDSYPVLDGSHAIVSYSDEYGFYNMTDDGPVGINEIKNEELRMKNDGGWFDLSGRKLNGTPTKAGLYILNGKKVLVK